MIVGSLPSCVVHVGQFVADTTVEAGELAGDVAEVYPRTTSLVKMGASMVSPTAKSMMGIHSALGAAKTARGAVRRYTGYGTRRRSRSGTKKRRRTKRGKMRTGPRGGRYYVRKGRKIYV